MPEKETASATWARRVKKWRRQAAEMREHGFEVVEPAGLETPPHKRIAIT